MGNCFYGNVDILRTILDMIDNYKVLLTIIDVKVVIFEEHESSITSFARRRCRIWLEYLLCNLRLANEAFGDRRPRGLLSPIILSQKSWSQ
jgi:hypothetical protein